MAIALMDLEDKSVLVNIQLKIVKAIASSAKIHCLLAMTVWGVG